MRPEIIFVEASTTGAGARASELARDEGLHVVLLTRKAVQYSDDVLAAADKIVACETNDAAQVAAAVQRRVRRSHVVAITTTADMYVPQAALAAQELGLPGLRYEAALNVRNKHRMRLALAQSAPEHNPAFFLVRTIAEARAAADQIGFPLVMKPQEENDGVGVKLVHDHGQLAELMAAELERRRNSAGQLMPAGILMEAYITGPELSVETIQYRDGPCQVIGVTSKEMTGLERGHFVEIGHAFPHLGAEAEVAAAATVRVLSALGIDLGAAHTECRVNGDRVTIMEINARLAGGKIGSHLIEMATGVSAVRAVLDAALGRTAQWRPERRLGAAIHFAWSDVPGIFRGILNASQILKMPGITAVSPIAKPGSPVRPPESNGDTVAEILATGANASEALANAKAASASLRLSIESEPRAASG